MRLSLSLNRYSTEPVTCQFAGLTNGYARSVGTTAARQGRVLQICTSVRPCRTATKHFYFVEIDMYKVCGTAGAGCFHSHLMFVPLLMNCDLGSWSLV
jgi:hypothetical protein